MTATAERPDKARRAGRRLRRPRLFGPQPIALVLFLLVVITIVPALLFSIVLLRRNNDAQQEVVITLAETAATSITESVNRELVGMVTTLRVLSSAPSVVNSDMRQFYDRAKVALAGTGAYLIVLDGNFNQLMNTRVPFGTALGPTSDPDSARRALESGGVTISNAFYGSTSQKWVFNVLLPLPDTGGVPRLLVLTQNTENLADALAERSLRGGWNVSLVDGRNVVMASTFMSSDVGKPFFLDVSATSEGRRIRAEVGGDDYVALASRSELTGWQTIVWAPAQVIDAPMRQSMLSLALGGAVVIAIGGLGAVVIGRQIAKPVRRLAADARRLGAGEVIEAKEFPITEITTVSAALADAARDRKKAETDIRLLMREVAHRSKNQLTVVSSLAKQSARNARNFTAFQDSFQKRLHGLARSTDLLIAGGAAGVELKELLAAQIEPFGPGDRERLTIDGPRFRLSNQSAQTLGLAIHEMATNAAKYGAFSVSEGTLSVTWSVSDGELEIVWREKVPRLRRRTSGRGFGTEVIERMLGGTLDARIDRTFHRDGLEARFRLPVEKVQPDVGQAAPDKPFD